MKNKIYIIAFIVTVSMVFTACKKDSGGDTPTQPAISKRVVKYEITGNYTGKLLVAFTTASGGTDNASINALPWSKEITYNNTVGGIGFGGGTDVGVGQFGIAGQTATVKIYSGGNVVITESPSIANSSGVINLPTTAYQFP